MEHDYSSIRDLILHENHNLGLAYTEGYVFLKVLNREITVLYFDPSLEMGSATNLLNIPANTFRLKQQFSSQSTKLNAPNILKVTKDFHVYQVFMGVQPSQPRVFLSVEGTEQRELDVANWGTNNDFQFGFINGWQTQFRGLGPEGEFFIPPQLLYEFAVFNPLPYTVSPVFLFLINRLEVAIIRDANTIQKMLAGVVPVRLSPIGGLTSPKFNMREKWVVAPLPVNATADEIQRAVAARR